MQGTLRTENSQRVLTLKSGMRDRQCGARAALEFEKRGAGIFDFARKQQRIIEGLDAIDRPKQMQQDLDDLLNRMNEQAKDAIRP